MPPQLNWLLVSSTGFTPDTSWWEDAWDTVTDVVDTVVDGATTIANAVLDTIGSLPFVGPLLDALAAIARAVFSIPYLGGVLRWIWDVALTLIWTGAQFIDLLLTLLGFMPEKRLKLRIIIQQNETGESVMEEQIRDAIDTEVREAAAEGRPPQPYAGPLVLGDAVLPLLQAAIDVFKEEANVRILPVGYFRYSSAFQDVPAASESEFIVAETTPSTTDTLDVCCDSCAFGDNLTTVGPKFQRKMIRDCFGGNASSILGYGAPVCAFYVREFTDDKLGCSVPLTDYVTVDFYHAALNGSENGSEHGSEGAQLTLAHELGHACSLTHAEDWYDSWVLWNSTAEGNLMNDKPEERGRSLSRMQKAILRTSRHVTYFDLPF